MPARFFLTTAIDYTNAAPHIGHAYEKILADVMARYRRLRGDSVYFLTGVDQHGQKVQQKAAELGEEPKDFAVRTATLFSDLWTRLGLSYDGWAATVDPRHVALVQTILQRLMDKGDIYQAPYRGFYSVRQEQFLTDKERGPDGNFGPEWGEVLEIEENTWYFRLSRYKDWLLEFLDKTPELVAPAFRGTELRNAAERLGGDLSISRPKSRLKWGIEIPFDRDYVTYVWFDALTNYLSFAGYDAKSDSGLPQFSELWPAFHIIGKDILIPAHGIYWLCMLRALGFTDAEMPRFFVHGYVLVDGEKMSKSIGNIRDPHEYVDRFGAEALRYYLMRACAHGQDMDFTDARLVQTYDSDLAKNVGNLLNRSLSMAQKYREGRLVRQQVPLAGGGPESYVTAYRVAMEEWRIHHALEACTALATECNQLVDVEKPWALAKEPDQSGRLDALLYQLAESLRIIAILLSPVMPVAAAGIRRQLAFEREEGLAEAIWGGLPDGHLVGKPEPLFPRFDLPVS